MNKKAKIILISLIILISGIIGVMKGLNMKKQEPIPQEVIDFAELQKGDKIDFEGYWNGYKVYYVWHPSKEIEWSLPIYILYNDKTLRYYNPDELVDLETNIIPATH